MEFVKQKPLNIALDCDDVLVPCMEKAIDFCNAKYNLDMSVEEVTSWLPCGSRVDVIMECFEDEEFFKTQKPFEGAQDMIRKLSKIANVYILTAVPIEFMGIRAKLIKTYFPEIPDNRIIMTSAKNLVHIDILLDDGSHNILTTPAKFPVLMRRPWNKDITGILSVNNYSEFLKLVDQIRNRYVQKPRDHAEPCVVALVGPSGTGKTSIAEKLIEDYSDLFEKPKSYTTRKMRNTETSESYHFTDVDNFKELRQNGEIFESTIYSGNLYGSSKNEVQKILDKGKCVVLPLDMCGAIGVKTAFDNAIIIYVDRHKRDILNALISREIPVSEKVSRIISMEAEERNSELCDYILENNKSIDDAAKTLIKIVK